MVAIATALDEVKVPYYERQALKRVNRVKMKGAFVNFASVEEVIIRKIFSGRPRDIEDIKAIVIKNPRLDTAYLGKWLDEFNKSSNTTKFTETLGAILKERGE